MTDNIIEEAAIMEEIQQAKAAPEPGMQGLREGVKDSGKDIPTEVGIDTKPKIKWLSSAGYVYVWDNQTGERSTINRNMLQTQLQKRRPDGSRIFTTIDPKIPVVRGNYKCMLHQKHEDRKNWEHIVFIYCKKENLRNPYEVRRHMEKRHPQEWKAIQEEITRKEKEEEREFRRALVGATKTGTSKKGK